MLMVSAFLRSVGAVVVAICWVAHASAVDIEVIKSASESSEQAITYASLTRMRSHSSIKAPTSLPEKLVKVTPDFNTIKEANRFWYGREVMTIDFSKSRWRLSRIDGRDLDSVLQSLGQTNLPRSRISQSMTVLADDRSYFLTFHPDNAALGITPVPNGKRPALPLTTGVIPSDMLSQAGGVSIDQVNHEGRPCERVVAKLPSCEATYYADPEIGYRFRTAELRSTEGTIVWRKRLSDYRVVDGIPYPFICVEQQYGADGLLVSEAVLTTETVHFNAEIDQAEFALTVPPDTSVSVFVGPLPRVFTTNREVTVNLDSAPGIWNLFADEPR